MRARRSCGLGESCAHVACALLALVVIYLLAGLVGDAAVAATRYFSG
ncbi:hypothetical protein [Sphingomonas sp.]|nr:hypothetical protein [Sphingomonas sp.]